MKETIIKLGLVISVVAICLTILFAFVSRSINSEISKEKQKYEIMIGKKLLLGKDSVIIVDYSLLNETFTLSDGRVVSQKLIK